MLFNRNDHSTSKAMIYSVAGCDSTSISKIIESLSHSENENTQLNNDLSENDDAIKLLESTQAFLNSTSLHFQQARGPYVNDNAVKGILESAGIALINFQKKPLNAFRMATLQYCISCLNQQLNKLAQTNDPIYAKYITLPNSLHSALTANASQANKPRR